MIAPLDIVCAWIGLAILLVGMAAGAQERVEAARVGPLAAEITWERPLGLPASPSGRLVLTLPAGGYAALQARPAGDPEARIETGWGWRGVTIGVAVPELERDRNQPPPDLLFVVGYRGTL